MTLMEVAVYALVLANSQDPFTCTAHGPAVGCTNGYQAALNGDGDIEFQTGVKVEKTPDGRILLSNGVTTHWGAAGWLQFSNGLSVRRMSDGSFRFNNGMQCRNAGKDQAGRDTVQCRSGT